MKNELVNVEKSLEVILMNPNESPTTPDESALKL